ncbi:MAG: DUF5025 domain-containing protein [Flavobacterium sp.]|nr:DUF5025 domain-containing protein [Flavobacterium sp.]
MKNLSTLLVILVLNACTKNDAAPKDQLPPATAIGANTAGCYINGELLVPKNGNQAIGVSPLYGLTISAGLNFNAPIIGDDYWQLEIANKRDNNSSGVILWIKNMQGGFGNYVVDQSNGELYADGPNNNQIIVGVKKNGVNKTYFSSLNSGTITITRFDYVKGIYSGTFNCILYNKDNPSERIQITEGRFDISVATLNR